MNLNAYLDAVLMHLKAEHEGRVRNRFGQRQKWDVDAELDLLSLHFVDLVGLSLANVELEPRFWTGLPNAGWIHKPVEWGLRQGLETIAHQVRYPGQWSMDFGSPHLDAVHAALSANKPFPQLAPIGTFLARCHSPDRTERYFSWFPLAHVPASEAFYPTDSEQLLMVIIEIDDIDDERRGVFIGRLVEELPGLHLRASVEHPWDAHYDFGLQDQEGDHFNALGAAASRGYRDWQAAGGA
ncbi:hypothetical protein S40293_10465 [Stachybotrys chartarum IBT 40293]|nr:hypothetical protein S40293_10465 [Stachybotrys chartarum IBT 40293]